MANETPMFRQYLEIKKLYPGTILFFRLGDFYEMFNEDAQIGSRELDITLTARHKDSPNPIPMCGIPHHSAAGYIAKLVKKGYRVAICEQTEDASLTKNLVKREVVRVITPATAIDSQLLEKKDSIYLAAVAGSGESFGAAFLELSTGEFFCTEINGADGWNKISTEIENFSPRELLFPASLAKLVENSFQNSAPDSKKFSNENVFDFPSKTGKHFSTNLIALDDYLFEPQTCCNLLTEQFAVKDLKAYGIDNRDFAIRAAGACLRYARETQKSNVEHIGEISFYETSDHLILDPLTLRNLEITESNSPENSKQKTLFGVLDNTITPMGARLLKSWLLRPSIKRGEIQTRLNAVAELTDTIFRDKIRTLLREINDLERLVGKLNLNSITPRDLLALKKTLEQLPKLNLTLSDASNLLLQVLSENIFSLPEIYQLLDDAIDSDSPVSINDGGVIKSGFDNELDELRVVSRNAKQTIAAFEEQIKQKTGINSLRIKFNNVFGYFIEVSKSNASRVPPEFERRQTLTNAERYTTSDLKEWEVKVLGAEDRIKSLEIELFQKIRGQIREETRRLQSTARALATLDALASLAEIAVRQNYVAPELHDGDEIEIKEGRHPIVETFSREHFIANDILLNNSTDRLLIITGANMSGKSTIMRQIALIQILAQIGSFVPADSARLPILDRIWTRVGASDDLASGRSTFMVEMTETAAILHKATPRSLILLDEIGRGTSTFDGLSIAWAVAEYLHDSPEHAAKTLFATHYHELTELAENLAGAKNYQITAAEKDGEIVFLHKLAPGKASKSYGIAVAKLAGLPPAVVGRANEVLKTLEKYELAVFSEKGGEIRKNDIPTNSLKNVARSQAAAQISLFALSNENAIDLLREIDIQNMSAEEAKKHLEKIQKMII